MAVCSPARAARVLVRVGSCVALVASVAALAQNAPTPPRLVAAEVSPSPWNVRSGGIAAFDVTVDESGAVASAEVVQDVAPYSDMLREDLQRWRFEPARDGSRAVPSRVLVLGFFRPPETAIPAPARPRYKDTTAPEELPWPTSAVAPPYPPNALGSGKVLFEVEVSDAGKVTGTRVLNPGTPFEGAATGAVKAWEFRPASRNGRPVAARAYFVFSFVGTTP
jgi:TonB family protein